MGVQVFTDAYVYLNSIDQSAFVKSVTLSLSNDVPETTAMGVDTRVRIVGLKDWSVEITLNDDWDVGSIDNDLWDIYDGAVAVPIAIQPNKTSAISTSNPEYQGNCVMEGYSPVAGSVGDVAEKSITFQAASAIVRDVTP